MVTSPAPQVSTTSPGRARSARCPATADQDGSKTTCAGGSGTAAATSAPVTPGTGSSRAAYTSMTTTSSASPSAAPNSAAKSLGAAEQVRLEHDDDPAAAGHLAGGAQVGGQLGRVVGVAVEDPDAARRCP